MSALCCEELARDLSAQRPALPILSHRAVHDLAALWHRDPQQALAVAEENERNWRKSK